MAAILAIAGIVMMTYADGFHSHSVIGIALVVGSASMSALYKVGAGNPLPQRAPGRQCSALALTALPPTLDILGAVWASEKSKCFQCVCPEADGARVGSR